MRIQASSTPLTLYDSRYVNVIGDTMTGDLAVGDNTGSPSLSIAKADAAGTGTLKFTIDGGSVRARLVQDTSENLTLETLVGDHDLKLQTKDFASAIVIDNGLARVGIGQVPTTQKLQVNGSVSVASGNAFRAGDNWLIGNSGTSVQIGSASVANDINFLSTTSSTLMTLTTLGKLSINQGGNKDQFALTSTTFNTGITIGADTNLYRSAANTWSTDDSLVLAGATSSLDLPNADSAGASSGWITSAGRSLLGISSGNKTMVNVSSAAGGEVLFITGGTIANTLGGITNTAGGGKFYIGTSSAPASGAQFSVTAASTTVAHFFNTAASGSAAGAGMIGYSDDGAALASGDRLGFFLLGGSTDGSHTLFNGAGIQAFTTEGWSGSLGGTELRLEVTPNGSHTRVVPLTLGQDSTATLTGNLTLSTVGKGILIKEGSNATMGTATLSAGTVVVSTTKVTANSRIFLQVESLGTVILPKSVGVTARTAATSFTITSSDVTDTSVVAWLILEPS